MGKELSQAWSKSLPTDASSQVTSCLRAGRQFFRSLQDYQRQLSVLHWLNSKSETADESRYLTAQRWVTKGVRQKMETLGCRETGSEIKHAEYTGLGVPFDDIVLTFEGCNRAPDRSVIVKFPSSTVQAATELDRKVKEGYDGLLAVCGIKGVDGLSALGVRGLRVLIGDVIGELGLEDVSDIISAAIDSWDKARREGKRQRVQQVSLAVLWFVAPLRFDRHGGLRERLTSKSTDRFVGDLQKTTQVVLASKTMPIQAKVDTLWLLAKAELYLGGTGSDTSLALFADGRQVDAVGREFIEFSLGKPVGGTVQYPGEVAVATGMVMAEAWAQLGRDTDASRVLHRLLLLDLGVDGTGIRLRKPIDAAGYVTPYPVWLAIVPAYSSLLGSAREQNGQLTAEQHDIARRLSRDQYSSGIGEDFLWSVFASAVVN